MDLQGTGFWLTALFGDPVSTAASSTGSITFTANPSDGDTVTLNGATWTFVAADPSGNETLIAGTVIQTIDALVTNLNASADAEVAKCTYSRPTGTQRLNISFDTAGTGGNTFTIAASAATVSGATLSAGGGTHVWTSGSDAIPSYTVEIGHPKLVTPVFFRHLGTVAESLAFDMGLEGPANARLQLVAQGEATATTTVDGSATAYSLRRFSQGRGAILKAGVQLAGVTGGSLTFSNNLERVRVIREDGKIEAADPTLATATGTMTVRFDGATLVNEATNGEPVSFDYRYSFADGYYLRFELPRVFLPKPKYAVSGPGGVEASFDWRGAYDETLGTMLRVHLLNNVVSYA